MSDIKTKLNKVVKALDKSVIVGERLKDSIVYTKNKAEGINNGGSAIEDATDKIEFATNRTTDEVVYRINKHGKDSVFKSIDNYRKAKVKIKNATKKLTEKRKIKNLNKQFKGQIKNVNKGIKNTKKTYKITKQSVDKSKMTLKLTKESVKKTGQSIKVAAKTTWTSLKAIIAGTRALITFIIAGGWLALTIIIIIMMMGMFFRSAFGIFISSEGADDGVKMSTVINELNIEMANKINSIQKKAKHDDYTITGERASWKVILALFSAKVSNDEDDVVILTPAKVRIIKDIFWDMNEITYSVKQELVEDIFVDVDGTTTITTEDKKMLHIVISNKSVSEMESLYSFTEEQKKLVKELLNEENDSLWASAIYGTPVGSINMVDIAIGEIGNIGGEKFWKWYGFKSRAAWCAIFVSWVAEQAGYLEAGIIPKFSGVDTGIKWFKVMEQWKDRTYTPMPGDLIFFDWNGNGHGSHVGIVEKVEGATVYTIEGNTTDSCARRNYPKSSSQIMGYGVPAY